MYIGQYTIRPMDPSWVCYFGSGDSHYANFAELNTTEWQQEQPLPSWSPKNDFLLGMLDHRWQ